MGLGPNRSKLTSLAVMLVLGLGLAPAATAWASPEAAHGSKGSKADHAGHDHGHGPGHTHGGHGHAHGAHAPKINWFDFNKMKDGGSVPLIAPLVNFAIVVLALVYFLRKPMSIYLSDRHVKVRDDLEEAARLREEAKQQLATIDTKLDGLDKEIAAIKDAVARDAEEEKDRIIEAAKKDADALVESAERTLHVEIERAKRKLEVMAIQAALQSAEKLLRTKMTKQDHDRLLDEYYEQIQQAGGGN